MDGSNKNASLLRLLKDYAHSGAYPMHMPGHKRNGALLGDGLPWGLDITEIEGFDNLHDPSGILADCGAMAAELWGSDYAFPLVNGSTCGILAGIYACAGSGGKILMAANCHQSVWHAVELCGLSPVYLYPHLIEDFGIFGSVSPRDVEQALEREADIRLAVITSPTYEGVVSDISGIAELLHNKGIPLLIDEAHGAHLGLFPGCPDGAVRCGADIAIHSLHKTLPSLTQTAMLHTQGGLVSREKLRHSLSIFQTSSPSYPLLASIDKCVRLLAKSGGSLFEGWLARLTAFSRSVSALERIRIFGPAGDAAGRYPGVFTIDPGKLVLSCKGISLTGMELSDKLLREHDIQLEMAMEDYALAMTSVCDTDEGMERLAAALLHVDRSCGEVKRASDSRPFPTIIQKLSIKEALELPGEIVPLSQSGGTISGEYICPYPPGIPLLVPGCEISGELIEASERLSLTGVTMHRTFSSAPGFIRVVK